jgi:hypothetical protein
MGSGGTEEPWYPNEQDIGIDEGTRRRLASFLLDESIDLPDSKRVWTENRLAYCTEEKLLAYGRWLCAVCQIETGDSETFSAELFTRASKLNLGPSRAMVDREERFGSFSEYKRRLELKPRNPFRDWSKQRMVAEGAKFSAIYGRLSEEKLDELSRDGAFPGIFIIKDRFGNLRTFHEYVGTPSFRHAEDADYIAWGVAVKLQNPGVKLDWRVFEVLSRRKVGPSSWPIYRRFVDPENFWHLVDIAHEDAEFKKLLLMEAQDTEISRLIEAGTLPPVLVSGPANPRTRLVAALYQIRESLDLHIPPKAMSRIALKQNGDEAVLAMVRADQNTTVALIEIEAGRLGVDQFIWSYERFANADLLMRTAA